MATVFVTLPEGVKGGAWFRTKDANGMEFAFQVPEGLSAGHLVEVEVPSHEPKSIIKVRIPKDAKPGSIVRAKTSDGQYFKIAVPQDKGPGDVIKCAVRRRGVMGGGGLHKHQDVGGAEADTLVIQEGPDPAAQGTRQHANLQHQLEAALKHGSGDTKAKGGGERPSRTARHPSHQQQQQEQEQGHDEQQQGAEAAPKVPSRSPSPPGEKRKPPPVPSRPSRSSRSASPSPDQAPSVPLRASRSPSPALPPRTSATLHPPALHPPQPPSRHHPSPTIETAPESDPSRGRSSYAPAFTPVAETGGGEGSEGVSPEMLVGHTPLASQGPGSNAMWSNDQVISPPRLVRRSPGGAEGCDKPMSYLEEDEEEGEGGGAVAGGESGVLSASCPSPAVLPRKSRPSSAPSDRSGDGERPASAASSAASSVRSRPSSASSAASSSSRHHNNPASRPLSASASSHASSILAAEPDDDFFPSAQDQQKLADGGGGWRRPSLDIGSLEPLHESSGLHATFASANFVPPSPKPPSGTLRVKPVRVSGVAIMVDTILHEGLGTDESVFIAKTVLHTDDELASTRAQDALAVKTKKLHL